MLFGSDWCPDHLGSPADIDGVGSPGSPGSPDHELYYSRKIQLGNSLLLGIGGATTGGLLWQYHERGSGQIGDIFLQVGKQATSQLILKSTNPVLAMLAHLKIPGSD